MGADSLALHSGPGGRDSQPSRTRHRYLAVEIFEGRNVQNAAEQFAERFSILEVGTKQEHSGVGAGGMEPDVRELLVSGQQESSFSLSLLPDRLVARAAGTLRAPIVDLVAPLPKQVRGAARKVLVDLDFQGGSGDGDEPLLMEHVSGVGQGGLDVGGLKLRVLADDLGRVISEGEAGHNDGNGNARSADAGLTASYGRLGGDSSTPVVHDAMSIRQRGSPDGSLPVPVTPPNPRASSDHDPRGR